MGRTPIAASALRTRVTSRYPYRVFSDRSRMKARDIGERLAHGKAKGQNGRGCWKNANKNNGQGH